MFNRIRIGAGQRWIPSGRLLVVAIAALLVCWSSTPRAAVVGDAVMEWNQIAVTHTLAAFRPPVSRSTDPDDGDRPGVSP